MRYYPKVYYHKNEDREHIIKSESLRVLAVQIFTDNKSYVIVPGDIVAYKILGNFPSKNPQISLVKPVEKEYEQMIKKKIKDISLKGPINFW